MQKAADLIRGGQKPDMAWERAINLHCDDVGFTTDDRGWSLISQGIGQQRYRRAVKALRNIPAAFSDRLKRARTDAQYKGRLYITLGICGGLGAALLML